LATALLLNYYRRMDLLLLSLIPFFTGMGLFALVAILFHLPFTFVSLIAVVMVFGLSLDYGIFATNLYTGRSGPTGPGVWSSVRLAATVTMFGFGPLVAARHPVLAGLGQVLFWGTAGTILGSVWGIPGIHWLWQRRRHA
jgi:predicted exporter